MGFIKKKYRKKRKVYGFFIGRKQALFIVLIIGAMFLSLAFSQRLFKDGKHFDHIFSDAKSNNNRLFFKDALSGEPQAVMSYASAVFLNPTEKKEGKNKNNKVPKKEIPQKSIESVNLDIKNETDYPIDALELEKTPKSYDLSGKKPKILIIHTHGSETYSDNSGNGLGKDGSHRTTDTQKNMVSIGERMAEVFEENNIAVIHDKTLCDYPSYNSSYVKSLGVIEWYLERYPQIEFVFDIHRDAIEEDGIPTKLATKINGKSTAQAMIVCGTDAMGLSNPFWKDNLILALKIQKNLEDMYPGFMRPLNIRRERFNMHKTKGSLLFEIGTHGNTQLEALRSAEILAEGIIKTLKMGM